jgi:hypothetical protein
MFIMPQITRVDGEFGPFYFGSSCTYQIKILGKTPDTLSNYYCKYSITSDFSNATTIRRFISIDSICNVTDLINTPEEKGDYSIFVKNNSIIIESTKLIDKIELYNYTGQIVYSSTKCGYYYSVNNMNNNIYILAIYSKGRRFIKKIFKW